MEGVDVHTGGVPRFNGVVVRRLLSSGFQSVSRGGVSNHFPRDTSVPSMYTSGDVGYGRPRSLARPNSSLSVTWYPRHVGIPAGRVGEEISPPKDESGVPSISLY